MSENNYLKTETFWKILAVLIAVFSTVIGYTLTFATKTKAELDTYKGEMFAQITSIKEDVATVKSDTSWLKNLFEDSQITIK